MGLDFKKVDNSLKLLYSKILDYKGRKVFGLIHSNRPELSFKEHVRFYKKYKTNSLVYSHTIGFLYSEEETRTLFLTEEEIELMSYASSRLDDYRALKRVVNEKGYNVLCDTSFHVNLIFNSTTVGLLRSNIDFLDKELKHIENEIRRYDFRSKKKESIKQASFRQTVCVDSLSLDCKNSLSILGIKANRLSLEDVKKAYKVKAKELHPDLNKGVEGSEFIRVKEAYDSLKCIFN